tara:strand:+ start:196 stop:1956 length:1761 start_codon:yes stop_codon:yes gene_type:complete
MWNLKGIEINNLYKVKHFIEKTSYCEVYSAIEIATSSMVNLSVYKKSEIAIDDLDEDGNLKEIQFLEIGIDAFPKLKTFGDFDDLGETYSYIATEFIVGESLSDRIKRTGALDEYDTVKIALKLCDVGEKLHNRSKPVLINGLSIDNIMIDMSQAEEQIKFRNLINMRLMNDDFKYNYLDGLSINQVAPEIFDNNFSTKSDQFNIGALVYQMHTGSLPLFSDESINLKDSNAREKFLEFRNDSYELSKNISIELKTVIQKALSKDPNDRYSSLSELSRFLNKERIVEGSQDNSNTSQDKSEPLVKRGNGFADIAGMDDLKNTLKSKIIDVIKRPEHFKKYGVTIPNGMLLYGPPGCGKTFISEKFCEEAGFNFFLVKASDVTSIYKSGGEQKIGELFKDAAANAPTVICFDEVDGIMPKRQSGESSQHKNSEVNEYLTQINKCSERGIFVIATTNKPDMIDTAILRTGRLEVHVYVPPPGKIARKKIFELYLKNRYSDDNIDYDKLASMTDNYVASDIEFIINSASHTAAIKEIPISMDIILNVIKEFKPSLNEEKLKEYEVARKTFENNDKSDNNSRTPIGFRRN